MSESSRQDHNFDFLMFSVRARWISGPERFLRRRWDWRDVSCWARFLLASTEGGAPSVCRRQLDNRQGRWIIGDESWSLKSSRLRIAILSSSSRAIRFATSTKLGRLARITNFYCPKSLHWRKWDTLWRHCTRCSANSLLITEFASFAGNWDTRDHA